MAPAAVAPALQTPEIQFAQRLAANEKRIRDRALKKLRGYITLRTQSPAGSFTREELLKIWKGLFYCMWMQDKPLLQLIRMMLRQSFEVLKRNGWNESLTETFLNMLMKEVLNPDTSAAIGVKLHFIDIYLEELAKVGAKELTADQNLKFIEPFCKIVAKTKDHLVLQAVVHGIFEAIVDQSPFAIEDLMKELTAAGDEEVSEDDEWSDDEDKLMAKGRGLSNKSLLGSETEDNLFEDAEDNIGPVLQFDYKMVADTLFELASRKNTPTFNRKRLYKVIKKFQDLAEGAFPQDDFPEDVSTDEDDDTFSRRKCKWKSGKPLDQSKLEKAENTSNRKDCTEEEENNTGTQKKRKKRKRKASQIDDTCTATGSYEKAPVNVGKSKEPSQDTELSTSKKRQKKSLSMNVNEAGSLATPIGGLSDNSTLKSLPCLVNSIKKQPKKKNGSPQKVPVKIAHQNGGANVITAEDLGHCATVGHDCEVPKKKWKPELGMITGNSFPDEAVQQSELKPFVESESTTLHKVKLKKNQTLGKLVKIRCSKQKIIGLRKQRKIKEVQNSIDENELQVANKKNRSDETGVAAFLLKKKDKEGNAFVKFEKTALPKPTFFRKAKGSITSMQLSKLQSSISKKVTFGLNKNMTAEFKKTDESILVSPEGASRVAFNPEQKPPHGVLKSPSGSSAGTPQIKKPFLMSHKKRPTAVDFF
ncbi:hypothetical protein EYD10_03179 [Varanus komodoensis]|nr:hypothetical protein EYD10_03179 [Varanus komodoensis]